MALIKKTEDKKLFQPRNIFRMEQNYSTESRNSEKGMSLTNQVNSERHLFIVPWQQIRKTKAF